MEKEINYEEVISRLGYFRNKANLSAREVSLRLGYTEQFIKRIESKKIALKVKTLLDFCEIVEITPQDFFYLGQEYNKDDKNILELFGTLSNENKQIVIDLIKKLR